MLVMQVSVVDVVHMVVVRDGCMAAVRAVHVRMTRVGVVC